MYLWQGVATECESTQESLCTPWILDIKVQSSKASAAKHSLPRLHQLTQQHYLFKLRQTAGVKRLIERQWQQNDWQNGRPRRCILSVRAVALIYNWWSWYVLAHPKTRLEAITSRPMLLSGIARLTQHAGQSRLPLTLTHAAGDRIKSMVANIRKGS